MNPLRAEFEALLADYRRDVPRAVERMEALLAGERFAELTRALHTLAGSAGTFKLPRLGDIARAAEDLLLRSGNAPNDAERAELTRLLAQLRQAA